MVDAATVSTRPVYMLAIVRALVAAGSSARPKAVYDMIEANGERRYPTLAPDVDPQFHYENAVRFARQELADGGLLAPTTGIWTLVEPEAARTLTVADAVQIIGENRRERERRRAARLEADLGAEQKAGGGEVLPELEMRLRVPRPTTGPKPRRYEARFRRKDGPASTYVFRFGASDIWKIGYAGNVSARLDHVNQHIPVEIIETGWQLIRTTRWPSQDTAYAMEQLLFRLLAAERTIFERVRCDEALILEAWDNALAATEATMAC